MTTATDLAADDYARELRRQHHETTALAEYDYSGIDFESDGNEGIAPTFPSIKIVQATSGMKDSSKHAGEFWHSDTETYSPTLDVVALLKRDTRAYFKEGEQEPACASNDGIAPRPNQPLWNGDQPALCADCPLSQWGEDGKPPACRESMVLLVDRAAIGQAEPDLAQLRIGGMSIRPYKRFVARKLAPKKLPIYTQALHLSTVEKIEAGKKWFELVIENAPLGRVPVEAYVRLLRAERARFAESIAHDTDAAPESVWGDGQTPFTGSRTPPVDADGVIQERRTPTPSPLSRTAAEMFPKYEPMEGVLPFDE